MTTPSTQIPIKTVLLVGDYILDNSAYVGPSARGTQQQQTCPDPDSVSEQLLRCVETDGFEVSHKAEDGANIHAVERQLDHARGTFLHIVISGGANDVLWLLNSPPRGAAGALCVCTAVLFIAAAIGARTLVLAAGGLFIVFGVALVRFCVRVEETHLRVVQKAANKRANVLVCGTCAGARLNVFQRVASWIVLGYVNAVAQRNSALCGVAFLDLWHMFEGHDDLYSTSGPVKDDKASSFSLFKAKRCEPGIKGSQQIAQAIADFVHDTANSGISRTSVSQDPQSSSMEGSVVCNMPI